MPTRPISIPTRRSEQFGTLEGLYRTTHEMRPRTSAPRVWLAIEGRLTAMITEILRGSEEMVRRWLKRHLADWVERSRNLPHPGAPSNTASCFRDRQNARYGGF